jgi:hypothetical protein
MDDLQVITQTLNNSLQRHLRTVGNYEVEIANLTADVIRLQDQVETLRAENLALNAKISTPDTKRINKES